MRTLDGITIPVSARGCRRAYLYRKAGRWILSTYTVKIATFDTKEEGENWWIKFEKLRGFQPTPLLQTKPRPKLKKSEGPKKKMQRTAIKKTPTIAGDDFGRWTPGKVICPVCCGDGGATGHCFKCGGCGWA